MASPETIPVGAMPAIGDAAIRARTGPSAFAAGRAYALAGRVKQLRVSPDGRTITAETRGSIRQPYRQTITLLTGPAGGPVFDSQCSCPVGGNCKHVAAVLVAARLAGHAQPPPRPPARPASPPAPPAEPALPYPVQAWLRSLDQAEEAASEAYPRSIRQRLFYVLDLPPGPRPSLRIEAWTATLRQDGSPGNARRHALRATTAPARFLRPSDLLLLKRLARLGPGHQGLEADDDPPDLLRRIIATGRAHWGELTGPILTEGPVRPGRIAWAVNPDGSQQPRLGLEPGLLAFATPAPWYANPASGEIGPVDAGLPELLVRRLLAAPPIEAEQVPLVAAALAQRDPAQPVPPPATLPAPTLLRGPPVPRLRLTTAPVLPYHGYFGGGRSPGVAAMRLPVAQLGFNYGPVAVAFGAPSPGTLAQDGQLFRLRRDPAAEQAALRQLSELGFRSPGYGVGQGGMLVQETEPDWLDFLLRDAPALRGAGWRIEVAEDFPLQLVEPEAPPTAEVTEAGGIDWFELHLGVMVDGQRIDLVPALVQFIDAGMDEMLAEIDAAEDEKIALPLPDGRILALPIGQVRPILAGLLELGAGEGDGRLRFTRQDAAGLAALEAGAGLEWQGGEALRSLGRQLREAGGAIPVIALPEGFRGALRPYQAEGLAWLQFLREAGLGGVLADDMGLGKTVQTLAHLAVEQAAGRLDRPALIVCPTSLIPNWTLEAARFAPGLKLLALHGPARRERFGEIPAHDLVLTTYPLLARDHAVLTAQEWHVVVLDEAQTIKNPNAETTRQALRLRARQRLCLSGTPLQNHLGELWSLFDFLAPGFLGSARAFRSRYRTPIEKHGDTDRQAMLHRRVRPFLLRRTKDAVADDLPPKTEITEPVELGEAQRGIYEGIRLAMHAKVQAAIAERGLARSGIIILDALLKLRQACCDPRLLPLKAAQRSKAGSAKLDRLMDLLPVLLAEGRRVLVFSQFTTMLALIEARLAEAGIAHVLLTGDTKDRATPVRRFQAGEVPVFLISLKAGGVGLNLTAADTVIHYDPWWNPAVEDQATDRAHRIGQDKQVFVHRLVALGTIEEKMTLLKDRKRALVAAVLAAEQGGALKLTEADVEALFAPA